MAQRIRSQASTRGRHADVAVVGAGIVGLAVARTLALRHPRLRIAVLEKESGIGQHQTGRSSGVIHSGVYYAPGSLKAQLCVRGAAALRTYCDERSIPYRVCGKVIVAREPAEVPRLLDLHDRGRANGVPGLELIGPERLRELEPYAAGVQALHVPGTGIVDYAVVAKSLAADFLATGGNLVLGHEVVRIVERPSSGLCLSSTSGDVIARRAVFCAGVYSDRLARLTAGAMDPRIVPFRGDYYTLRPHARHLANALVYPVPDPRFPFLGVHTTLRMDGSMWLGPNAVLAFGRESYGRYQIRVRDTLDTFRSPGFRRLARKHLRLGLSEMARDYNKRLFVAEARTLLPELQARDVERAIAGIRAQTIRTDGELVDDFVLERHGATIHVRNAPSPGATSSLMIGEKIASVAEEAFGL